MTDLIHSIQHHPVIALVITVINGVLGFMLPKIAMVAELHIPPIVIELLQCGAFISGMAVGVITVYTFFKKNK